MHNTYWNNGVSRTTVSNDSNYKNTLTIKYCDVIGKHNKTIRFYDTGKIYLIEYWQNGKLHNEDGPAYIQWYPNGQIDNIQYYQNGKRHNEHGPACILWYPNGQIDIIEHWHNGIQM